MMPRKSRAEYQRKRYQADPERYRAYLRKSYQKLREKRCAEQRARCAGDPEKARAYKREQYAKHIEKRREDARKKYAANKEKLAAKAREAYRANRDAKRARANELRKRPEVKAKASAATRRWQDSNPDKMRIHQAKRLIFEQTGIRASDIPDDLAEAKVEQLTITRWVKEQIAAQRIEARSDETPAEAVQPEGREPDGEADAPKDCSTPPPLSQEFDRDR